MDPISYGVAAKQKQRIEKVIAEPDSTSGVITVPQVIATGETITVPAGRTAVLPNVQVDGELVVDGEVFIPSGAGLSTVVQKSGDTMTGNLNFASGTNITGDFSSTTASSRTKIQSSIPNGNSNVAIIPNGTASQALLRVSNSSNTENYNTIDIVSNSASTRIQTTGLGTNQHTPLEFWTSGNEKMRIDTSGNVLVTGSGGLGYGTGSGGTVTQLTSKSTAVTLNKPCGRVIMSNSELANGSSVLFSLTNSYMNDTNTCSLAIVNNADYNISIGWVTNGAIWIRLTNISGIPKSDAVQFNFLLLKGANV